MPGDAVFKAVNRLQRGVMRLTGGRLGWRAYGMQVVELTTKGRRSGVLRPVLLTAPISEEDGGYVVVASRGGDAAHPAWYLNLRDDPEVEVRVRDDRSRMRARVLEGEERATTWAKVVEAFPHYERYQRKTERQIPLVRLEPA